METTSYLVKVFAKLLSQLISFPFLNMEHNPKRFSSLVRSKLVDQVVHVDEQQVQVFYFLGPFDRVRAFDLNV